MSDADAFAHMLELKDSLNNATGKQYELTHQWHERRMWTLRLRLHDRHKLHIFDGSDVAMRAKIAELIKEVQSE